MFNRLYHSPYGFFLAVGFVLMQIACAAPVTSPDQLDCAPQAKTDVISSPFLSVLMKSQERKVRTYMDASPESSVISGFLGSDWPAQCE
jgi:hypothetical protein